MGSLAGSAATVCAQLSRDGPTARALARAATDPQLTREPIDAPGKPSRCRRRDLVTAAEKQAQADDKAGQNQCDGGSMPTAWAATYHQLEMTSKAKCANGVTAGGWKRVPRQKSPSGWA